MTIVLAEAMPVFCKFSSFDKLQRVFAYVIQFANKTRRRKEDPTLFLSVTELNQARYYKNYTKSRVWGRDHCSKKGEPLSKQSRLLNVDSFLDENGLLRVGGRLSETSLSYHQKFPFVPITRKTSHYGTAHTTRTLVKKALTRGSDSNVRITTY